jgi:hypothetical protein
MPISVDIPSATPDTADEIEMLAPDVPRNSDAPSKEALELIQVVTDPTIMATDEAIRRRIPNVTPDAGRAVVAVEVVVVGCGA